MTEEAGEQGSRGAEEKDFGFPWLLGFQAPKFIYAQKKNIYFEMHRTRNNVI
ncbi:MAG: hypothetical protein ACYTXE_36645 [Nostoc sp.]